MSRHSVSWSLTYFRFETFRDPRSFIVCLDKRFVVCSNHNKSKQLLTNQNPELIHVSGVKRGSNKSWYLFLPSAVELRWSRPKTLVAFLILSRDFLSVRIMIVKFVCSFVMKDQSGHRFYFDLARYWTWLIDIVDVFNLSLVVTVSVRWQNRNCYSFHQIYYISPYFALLHFTF